MIYSGNCIEKLKNIADNSVDAVVTDPPYELGFMGKAWDSTGIAYNPDLWCEVLRVLKPGGHLLSFGGSRTYHRMACAIEDAGFEIRDQIMWVYGSGFPKSLNIGKAVDKLQGNERETIGKKEGTYADIRRDKETGIAELHGGLATEKPRIEVIVTKGNTEWEGWGTALKPAHEPIVLARKPLSEHTVAENVLKWGVGGLAIDNCRVETNEKLSIGSNKHEGNAINFGMKDNKDAQEQSPLGRFPANFIHDGIETEWSRFFYCAKASKSERDRGCEGLEGKEGIRSNAPRENEEVKTKIRVNNHPTVKPIALMKYLIKLVSREGQTILDPFMGSGTTGMAAKELNREFIGIEMNEEYVEIAKRRISAINPGNFETLSGLGGE